MKVRVLSLDTMEESVSFFNELDTKKELCSWLHVSFLHKIEPENNYACGDLFHFYTSLKQKITMLVVTYFIFTEA